jgi:hypothetical protein
MKIRIKYQDIVNYILGTSSYHPLEFVVDPMRYEVGSDHIYDIKAQKKHQQNDDYCKFISKIEILKSAVKDFDSLQVQSFCREIEQFAPLEINLS